MIKYIGEPHETHKLTQANQTLLFTGLVYLLSEMLTEAEGQNVISSI
jgi:hypothetical protein